MCIWHIHRVWEELNNKEKTLFISIRFFYIFSDCNRNQSMSRMSDGNSIKSWFSQETQNTEKLTILRKESELHLFHQKIDQTIKKEATNVDNKKLH